MKLNQHLKDWKQIVSSKFSPLSLPQVNGLATWSFGMVMTRSSSLSKVSTLIAKYADWLYQEIVELGWHPFLRINHQGQYRNSSSDFWKP